MFTFVLDLKIDFYFVSSINKLLQLCFRLFWKWREMNMPPSQAGSKLIWRRAKGCFVRQWNKLEADWCCDSRDFLVCCERKMAWGGHKNHVSTQRIVHSIIQLQRDHFYLCQISVWTFYWTFFKATKWLRENKQTFLLSVQISER